MFGLKRKPQCLPHHSVRNLKDGLVFIYIIYRSTCLNAPYTTLQSGTPCRILVRSLEAFLLLLPSLSLLSISKKKCLPIYCREYSPFLVLLPPIDMFVVTQIRGHTAGSPPSLSPSPHDDSCPASIFIITRTTSAISLLVHSHVTTPTHPTRSQLGVSDRGITHGR